MWKTLILCAAAAWPTPAIAQGTARRGGPQPNFLLILGDDIGVDRVAVYGEHPDPGNTPNLDVLASQGMLFRNAWAYEVCSSTRSAMLTGRHGRRTGLGTFILTNSADYDLPVSEVSLADVLAVQGYRTAAIGKWHLSAKQSTTDYLTHPLQLGFEHHWGPITNLPVSDGPAAYYDFDKNIDGTLVRETTYATTDQVDDTLTMIDSFGAEPWFIWLAFNAPHKPLHAPPASLHSFNLIPPPPPALGRASAAKIPGGQSTTFLPGGASGGPPSDPDDDPPLFMKAMTEAMDTEIGRLLISMDPAVLANTYVIFIGDNGTNGPSISPPWDPEKGKSTMFEGGVNVPLIIRGPTVVAGQESPALVHALDLYATIAELAGADASTAVDSTSFAAHLTVPTLPTSAIVYGERFRPNGFGPWVIYQQVARNDRYKYWRFFIGGVLKAQHLYDLDNDPFEINDLVLSPPLDFDAQMAWDELTAYVDALD